MTYPGVGKALSTLDNLFRWMKIETTQLLFVQSLLNQLSDLSDHIKLAKVRLFIYSKLEPENKQNLWIFIYSDVCFLLISVYLMYLISWLYVQRQCRCSSPGKNSGPSSNIAHYHRNLSN